MVGYLKDLARDGRTDGRVGGGGWAKREKRPFH